MTGMLTVTAAAALLGITASRIRKLIADGRLPAEKVGRDWLIREADLSLIAHRPTGRPRRSATPGE